MKSALDRSGRAVVCGAAALTVLAAGSAKAADGDSVQLASLGDLARLSIEELGEIEITSVSRRPEPVGQAPSAIFVITNEDIRRSGAMTLAETLRLAPNLHVARIDALDYSITPRGFGGFESANKTLVLIDGRSVYTPLFGGVDWDQQHVLLDDVERIEVISGPGGALWGANAVNGVINITSRPSSETQGLLVGGSLGTLDSDARLRYGGRLGAAGAYRLYGTVYRRGDLETATGNDAGDGWDGFQLGFRSDWYAGANAFTLQGDLHSNSIDRSLGAADGYVRGGDLLGRWSRQFAGGGRLDVQVYYDRIEREARLVYDALDTVDLDVQHGFSLGDGRHQIVWGGGYRVGWDEFRTLTPPQLLDPGERTISIANLFIQDEVALRTDLSLTLGLKLEENSYTGLEAMPSARLAWRLAPERLLWAAVSRAVRNPSRIERDFSIPNVVTPGFFEPEHLTAYEAGYRGRLTSRASLSVSLFYNAYEDLRTNDLTPPGVLPIRVANTMVGSTYGAEVWAVFDVSEWWRISAGGNWLGKRFRLEPGSLDVARFEAAGVDPDGLLKIRSEFQIFPDLDFDVGGRVVDDVPPSLASGYVGADGYAELDARLAWRPRPGLELSLTGMNLLHDRHAEASETRRSLAPRSVHVGLRWTR